MRKNKPPFALYERTKSAIVLAIIFSPLYYHVITEELHKKQPRTVNISVNDSIAKTDTTATNDRELAPVLWLHSSGE